MAAHAANLTTRSMDDFTFGASELASRIGDAYRTHGVVVVKQCLPAAVVAAVQAYLTEQLDRVQELFAKFGLHKPLKECGPDVADLLRSGAVPQGEDQHLLLGHFPLDVRLSAALKTIPSAMRSRRFLNDILGSSELFVHMPINARYILPSQTSSAVPTHQDISYNAHMKDFCVLWTPFSEIDDRCSGMAVYPGSHRLGPLAPPQSPSDNTEPGWLPKIDIGAVQAVPLLPLSPGDVVVFSDTTVHESMPNRSARIRLNVEARFFGHRAHTKKHYFDLQSGEVVNPLAANERN